MNAKVALVWLLALLAIGCVGKKMEVPLQWTKPEGIQRVTTEAKKVVVEPFIDARGMAILGRARNGYMWPMCAFVPEDSDAVSQAFTDSVKHLLQKSGFTVVAPGGSSDALVVRGSVEQMYCDAGFFFQTSTKLKMEVWNAGNLTASRIYVGYANPIMWFPSNAPSAFTKSLRDLLAKVNSDLPQLLAKLPQ